MLLYLVPKHVESTIKAFPVNPLSWLHQNQGFLRSLIAARLVVGTGKFSHVTPILRDVLHWLPVQHRISYKIAILARDCIHGIGPAYFGDVCAPVTAAPGRTNLRSATRGDLVIPRTRKNWANGVSVYPHRRCGTRSLIRSSILLQAANISGKN